MKKPHYPAPVTAQELHNVLDAQTQAYYTQGIPSLEQRLSNLDTLFDILKNNQHRRFQMTLAIGPIKKPNWPNCFCVLMVFGMYVSV